MAPMVRRVSRQQESTGFNKKRALALVLCLGILPGLWLQSAFLAAWLGEGRTHHLAVIGGLILLPLAGLLLLLRHHPRALKITALLWGSVAWVFTAFFWVVIPETTAQVISSHGAWMFSFAGAKTRVRGDAVMDAVSRQLPGVSMSVPFTFEQGSIVVDAGLVAGDRSLPVRLVLDTGASFTTISPEAAKKLGIAPGPRSPQLHVQTAGGEATYPLVVLSELTLGEARVGPLVAAVCAPCAVGDKAGLLGLNFTSHFQMVIDNKTGRVRMRPAEEWLDRHAEVEPFLEVHGLTGTEEGDLLRVAASVTNLAPAGVRGLAFELTLLDAGGRPLNSRRVMVEAVAAGETRPLTVEIAAHTDCASFNLELKQAFWAD
jgi:predicted aspartyl protease